MLAPFFLETLLNPDLTGPERPYVLAHEWAHLSGFAPEADAELRRASCLAARRPASQYSAWLELVSESASQLQPVTQPSCCENLAAGRARSGSDPRSRVERSLRSVERVAWATYDRTLKSQGVEEGVQSYSRVVQLLLGTDALKIPHEQAPSPKPQAHGDASAEGGRRPARSGMSSKRPPQPCERASSSRFRPRRSTDLAQTRKTNRPSPESSRPNNALRPTR